MKKRLSLLILCGLTLSSACVFAADSGAVSQCKKVAAYIHKYPAYDTDSDMAHSMISQCNSTQMSKSEWKCVYKNVAHKKINLSDAVTKCTPYQNQE